MTCSYNSNRNRIDVLLYRQGVVRARDLLRLGLQNADIDTFVRRDRLVRIARGIFASPAFPETPDRMLAAAALRVPRATICLSSAAFLHGLIDERPAEVWLAVGAKAWPPRVPELPLKFWWTSRAAGGLPVEERPIEGVPVRLFGPAATVAHLFARRDLVGEDVAVAALRRLLELDPAARGRIEDLAVNCRVAGAVRPHLAE